MKDFITFSPKSYTGRRLRELEGVRVNLHKYLHDELKNGLTPVDLLLILSIESTIIADELGQTTVFTTIDNNVKEDK